MTTNAGVAIKGDVIPFVDCKAIVLTRSLVISNLIVWIGVPT